MLPKTRKEASFLSEKNSRLVASSKGWMGFFFVNFLASGWRSWYRSLRASWVTWEQVVPRRKRTVFGFSTALGARFSRARLERALRGFLCRSCQLRLVFILGVVAVQPVTYICRNILYACLYWTGGVGYREDRVAGNEDAIRANKISGWDALSIRTLMETSGAGHCTV